MNEEQIQQIVQTLRANPDAKVSVLAGIKEIEPEGGWARYDRRGCAYIVIALGEEDVHIANSIRAALGHDPMTFLREKP
jgi:hypothetical protein